MIGNKKRNMMIIIAKKITYTIIDPATLGIFFLSNLVTIGLKIHAKINPKKNGAKTPKMLTINFHLLKG